MFCLTTANHQRAGEKVALTGSLSTVTQGREPEWFVVTVGKRTVMERPSDVPKCCGRCLTIDGDEISFFVRNSLKHCPLPGPTNTSTTLEEFMRLMMMASIVARTRTRDIFYSECSFAGLTFNNGGLCPQSNPQVKNTTFVFQGMQIS